MIAVGVILATFVVVVLSYLAYAAKIVLPQFQTDSGLSLRDAVNRLESAADVNRQAAEDARRTAEILSGQFEVMKSSLRDAVDAVSRMEVGDATRAVALAKAQEAVEGVAMDLARAHERADAVTDAPHGAAADAASRQTAAEVELTIDPEEEP